MMAEGCPLLAASAAAGGGADCLAFLVLLMAALPEAVAPPAAEEEEEDLVSRAPLLRSLIDHVCVCSYARSIHQIEGGDAPGMHEVGGATYERTQPPQQSGPTTARFCLRCALAALMAAMAAPQLASPSESEAVLALGSRTTMLHPEIKRHRAWWREILCRELPRRQAACVSGDTAAVQVWAKT